MEKIPAACAMEWSIELEKGLRSKKPGHRIKAIKQIGYKLQKWSMEPSITREISDIYGMVPGEDRLFANTILLRLADAFCNGDIEIRRCILKVFLVELQHITKMGNLYYGFLARKKVPNQVELLKRLKVVYDTGDLETKSLTLRLFGCWADIAKDSTHICFLILSSMQSSHNLEVKASLFAAGCFSRLSEDFAYIVLKILISIISSLVRSPDVRLVAARALANFQCSSAVRNNAYQAGRQVLLNLPMDDVKIEMLSSLSKLALGESLLFPEQLDLLQSFLSHEYPNTLKGRALRCLYTLLDGGSCHFLVSTGVVSALFCIFNDDKFPLKLQCLALRILQKIFSYRLLHLPIQNMPDLFKLVVVVNNLDTPNIKRELALTLLVDILCFVKEAGKEHWIFPANWLSSTVQLQGTEPSIPLTSSGSSPTPLVSNVLLLIMDHVYFLVKGIICSCHKEFRCIENLKPDSEPFSLKSELKFLLNLILRLAQYDPSSSLVALSKLRYIVHFLVSMINDAKNELCISSKTVSQKVTDGEKYDSALRPLPSDADKNVFVSALILYFCRFANAYINILHETSSITCEVLHILKDAVNCIKQCGYSCYNSYEVFCLIMHSVVLCYDYKEGEENKIKGADEICCYYSTCWLHQECLALDFTKKMLKKRSFWEVYKAGKYFCLQGLWFAATFSFRKLIDVANTGCHSYWIKALMLFVGGESEIKLLLFPKVSLELINSFQSTSNSDQPFRYNTETDACVGKDYDWNSFRRNLSRVCSKICSSEKVLESFGNVCGNFFFQKWFLYLRGKFLELVVESLVLLSSAEDKFKESIASNPRNATKHIQDMHPLLCSLARVSLKLNNLAKGYDLLVTSFIDINAVSFRSISRLGVISSTLSFCTSLATNVLNSPAFRNIIPPSINDFEKFSNIMIVQDLAERMWDIDCTTATKLMQFILVKDEVGHGLCSKSNMHSPSLFDNSSLSLIQSSITDILCVQTDLEAAKDVEDLIAIFIRGLQHQYCLIRKLLEIPLVTPKYFFRVRPCIGSELFIFHANSERRDELLVKPGLQLPLNLCIQLKNASSIKCASIGKIYCVLAVRASHCLTIGSGRRLAPAQCNTQAHMFDEMLWLSEILMLHLRKVNKEAHGEHHIVVDDSNLVLTYACFEPNKMGLGFSTCLLDVSHLSEGSYPIKWHSCCVDDRGFYWNLVPFNEGPTFTIKA